MPITTPKTSQEHFLSPYVVHELRQISPLRLKVLSKLENAFVFRHPFTLFWAGPTPCRKITWLKHLLPQAETMITPPHEKVL